jgi:hypothetical protein
MFETYSSMALRTLTCVLVSVPETGPAFEQTIVTPRTVWRNIGDSQESGTLVLKVKSTGTVVPYQAMKDGQVFAAHEQGKLRVFEKLGSTDCVSLWPVWDMSGYWKPPQTGEILEVTESLQKSINPDLI